MKTDFPVFTQFYSLPTPHWILLLQLLLFIFSFNFSSFFWLQQWNKPKIHPLQECVSVQWFILSCLLAHIIWEFLPVSKCFMYIAKYPNHWLVTIFLKKLIHFYQKVQFTTADGDPLNSPTFPSVLHPAKKSNTSIQGPVQERERHTDVNHLSSVACLPAAI